MPQDAPQPPSAAPLWRIADIVPENDDTTSVVIDAPPAAAAVFQARRPGQFAVIRVKRGETWSEPHPFTISCASGCNQLQFTIKSAGAFTSGARDWKPGTEIQCQGPYGAFCKDIESKDDIVMIAGGVGITPFLSVLRSFLEREAPNRVTLFWANKALADAFARRELEGMAKELDLTVIHALSREAPPDPSPGQPAIHYENGRINAAMLAAYMRPETASVYVCGPPAMQETMLQELARIGVARDAVQRETFSVRKPGAA